MANNELDDTFYDILTLLEGMKNCIDTIQGITEVMQNTGRVGQMFGNRTVLEGMAANCVTAAAKISKELGDRLRG